MVEQLADKSGQDTNAIAIEKVLLLLHPKLTQAGTAEKRVRQHGLLGVRTVFRGESDDRVHEDGHGFSLVEKVERLLRCRVCPVGQQRTKKMDEHGDQSRTVAAPKLVEYFQVFHHPIARQEVYIHCRVVGFLYMEK